MSTLKDKESFFFLTETHFFFPFLFCLHQSHHDSVNKNERISTSGHWVALSPLKETLPYDLQVKLDCCVLL